MSPLKLDLAKVDLTCAKLVRPSMVSTNSAAQSSLPHTLGDVRNDKTNAEKS
jgi:hypothetical protein